MDLSKRLIEVDLPIKRISEHARKDKNVKKGHLHTMHIWWATRPLASCRAVILASLLPDPEDSMCPTSFLTMAQKILRRFTGKESSNRQILRDTLLSFISDFSSWGNSNNSIYIEAAQELVQARYGEATPVILEPFAGGGAIPLETLRIGAQSFAMDLNPIPNLINKVAIEFLPKLRGSLAQKCDKWGNELFRRVSASLEKYYSSLNGKISVAYIWARTVICEGPGCGAELPLIGQPWLSQKPGSLAALKYEYDRNGHQIKVKIVHPSSKSEFQPPISKRFSATCPACGYTTPYKNVRKQIQERRGGARDARLLAVISINQNGMRTYRLPNDSDLTAIREARNALRVFPNFGPELTAVPDEPYPDWYSGVFNPGLWNMETWGDLFTDRQALALATFTKQLREMSDEIHEAEGSSELADAITTCLALAVSNLSHYLSSVSIWALDHMISAFVQGSGMAMRPDFAEANPLMPKLVGGFSFSLNKILDVLRREATTIKLPGTIQQGSATRIPLPDDSVDYVITDPPYYAAVPYSDLSDFCYVWLKRMLCEIYPDLFVTKLTPKDDEIIAYYVQPKDRPKKDSEFFETKMEEALTECRRVLKPDGVAVIIFAHKGTAGWEAMLNALIRAGWVVTASWPIDTERAARMRAYKSATLASSIHLVCRPRENPDGSLRTDDVGDWRDVLAELPERIHEWMPRLAKEGVVGADAIFACLGPALEIYSRYSSVEKASGKKVELKEYLEQVWAAVSREALKMIFEGADASGFEEDARLTAMWLWTLRTSAKNGDEDDAGEAKSIVGYDLEYDAARKIAQGLGAHLENLGHLVRIKGDTATLLSAGARTRYLFGKDAGEVPKGRERKKSKQQKFDFMGELKELEDDSGDWAGDLSGRAGSTVLDQLHQSMILFGAGRGEALKRFLVEDGVGLNPLYWRIAQALSALYPSGTDEKRWVDGVLARKKGLGF